MSRYDYIINDVRALKLDFRINDLNEALQVKNGSVVWKDLEDVTQAIIEVEAAELGYGVKGEEKPSLTRFWNACIKLGNEQRYHPIRDWLTSIRYKYPPQQEPGHAFASPWLNGKLAGYFSNPDGMFGPFLFRWMTGAIAKVLVQERNPMLVLVSEQRLGKSWFARWLCSPLGDNYFLEGSINPDSKDARIRLTDRFIHEVGELGATTRRADNEALKEFITKKFNSDRPPYGKRPITKPAVCSFIGSVNPDGAGFLNDPTGSTRFLACQINHIDFAYSQAIDPAMLWAEALWFYDNSEKPWELTPAEDQARERINSQFEIVNGLEDVVQEYLEVTNDPAHFMTTVQIRDVLSIHYRYTNEVSFSRDLARTLHKFGLHPTREPFKEGQGHHRGYRGIRVRPAGGDNSHV